MRDNRDVDEAVAELRLDQLQMRVILLDLVDALNAHQQVLGHLQLNERAPAASAMMKAGDNIASALDRIGSLIEADR